MSKKKPDLIGVPVDQVDQVDIARLIVGALHLTKGDKIAALAILLGATRSFSYHMRCSPQDCYKMLRAMEPSVGVALPDELPAEAV